MKSIKQKSLIVLFGNEVGAHIDLDSSRLTCMGIHYLNFVLITQFTLWKYIKSNLFQIQLLKIVIKNTLKKKVIEVFGMDFSSAHQRKGMKNITKGYPRNAKHNDTK